MKDRVMKLLDKLMEDEPTEYTVSRHKKEIIIEVTFVIKEIEPAD